MGSQHRYPMTTAVQALGYSWMVQLNAARDQLDPVEWKCVLEFLAYKVAREFANIEPRLRDAA